MFSSTNSENKNFQFLVLKDLNTYMYSKYTGAPVGSVELFFRLAYKFC